MNRCKSNCTQKPDRVGRAAAPRRAELYTLIGNFPTPLSAAANLTRNPESGSVRWRKMGTKRGSA